MSTLRTGYRLALVMLLLTSGLAQADESFAGRRPASTNSSDEVFELLGHFGGVGYDLAVQDDYAYVGYASGLVILDISNPLDPLRVGHFLYPYSITGVAVQGDYVYITWTHLIVPTHSVYTSYLGVLNVSDPAYPVEVGSYTTYDQFSDLVVVGKYAFIAGAHYMGVPGDSGFGKLLTFDVSDPTAPHQITYVALEKQYFYEIAVLDGYAYLLTWDELVIYDVVNPANPIPKGSLPIDLGEEIAVAAGYAYIVNDNGLTIVSVQDPETPLSVGYYPTTSSPNGVAVSGNYAYLAENGLRVVDISDPANLLSIGYLEIPYKATAVSSNGGFAYLLAMNGLSIVDISSPAAPTIAGANRSPGSVAGLTVQGDLAYASSDNSGCLWVLNLSDPENPTAVSFYDLPAQCLGVRLSGSYAYVMEGWDDYISQASILHIFDISDPLRLTEVSTYALQNMAWGWDVAGGYLYVGEDEAGLEIIDVRDAAQPVHAAWFTLPQDARDVEVVDTYAYVIDHNDGLYVIDISNPLSPDQVGLYSQSSLTWMTLSGDYAYACTDSHSPTRLYILDIRVPAHPAQVSLLWTDCVFALSGAYALALGIDYYYFYAEYAEIMLSAIHVADPGHPFFIGDYYLPLKEGENSGIVIDSISTSDSNLFEDKLYLSDGISGVYILHLRLPAPAFLPLVLR